MMLNDKLNIDKLLLQLFKCSLPHTEDAGIVLTGTVLFLKTVVILHFIAIMQFGRIWFCIVKTFPSNGIYLNECLSLCALGFISCCIDAIILLFLIVLLCPSFKLIFVHPKSLGIL